jgi:hypothetical protein
MNILNIIQCYDIIRSNLRLTNLKKIRIVFSLGKGSLGYQS